MQIKNNSLSYSWHGSTGIMQKQNVKWWRTENFFSLLLKSNGLSISWFYESIINGTRQIYELQTHSAVDINRKLHFYHWWHSEIIDNEVRATATAEAKKNRLIEKFLTFSFCIHFVVHDFICQLFTVRFLCMRNVYIDVVALFLGFYYSHRKVLSQFAIATFPSVLFGMLKHLRYDAGTNKHTMNEKRQKK